jgi:hypothetical protein
MAVENALDTFVERRHHPYSLSREIGFIGKT